MRLLISLFFALFLSPGALVASGGFVAATYDPFVGDWLPRNPGDYVAQIFKASDGIYHVSVLVAFDDLAPDDAPVATLSGSKASERAPIELNGEGGWSGWLRPDCCGSPHLELCDPSTGQTIQLTQHVRPNTKLRLKRPAGGVALFGKLVRDDIFEIRPGKGDLVSDEKFGAAHIHLEFRMLGHPSECGVLLHGLYRINFRENFARYDEPVSCGIIRCDAAPLVRAERAPLEWQSLDIEFQPAKVRIDGTGLDDAQMTVFLNGIMIYDNVVVAPLLGTTLGGPDTGTGPLVLEERGTPIQFRNIWILEK